MREGDQHSVGTVHAARNGTDQQSEPTLQSALPGSVDPLRSANGAAFAALPLTLARRTR